MTDPQADPIMNLSGELVALGPVSATLEEPLHRWLNDMVSFRTLGADPAPATRELAFGLLDDIGTDTARVTFVIYDVNGLTPIGTTSVTHIDHRHRTCEIEIAIMEIERRGKGMGTEAVRLVTDYAIRALDMHNVQLRVFAYNHAGLRAYSRAGFREYGRRRAAWLHHGERSDIVFMEVLAIEWQSPVVAGLSEPEPARVRNGTAEVDHGRGPAQDRPAIA